MKKPILILALLLSSIASAQVVLNSGVKVGNGTSAGVSSINTVQGAFTFTGSGVSCATTTCTFSGGGIPYPGAGVPLSTGTAWGTSYQGRHSSERSHTTQFQRIPASVKCVVADGVSLRQLDRRSDHPDLGGLAERGRLHYQ